MLVKFRPKRTYGEQYLVDELDVRGLMKALEQHVDETAGDGTAASLIYAGAHLALNVLFRDYPDGFRDYDPEEGTQPADTDYWTDFMRRFDAAVQENFD